MCQIPFLLKVTVLREPVLLPRFFYCSLNNEYNYIAKDFAFVGNGFICSDNLMNIED